MPPRPGLGVQKFILDDKEYRYYDVPVLQPGGEQRLMRGVIALDKINRRTNLFILGLFLGLPLFIFIAALGGY